MAINVRVSDFLGVALRGLDDAQMLVLVHRDPVAEHSAVRELRPRGDRLRLADVERHLRAAAVGGRRAARTGRPPPPPQRHPRPPPEISGAPPRRRFAQPGQHPSGRTRDHRAGLRSSTRHCAAQAGRANPSPRSSADRWIRFAALAMTVDIASRFSRRISPEVCIFVWPSSKSEGAGKTGCLLHPRSRVRFAQTKLHTSIQGSGSIPAFPAQWLYGLLRALPGERLSCHRRLEKLRFSQDLTPAPRRQDHTTSPYARAAHVSRSSRVHRISPRVRDDGQRPSSAVRRAELCRLICVRTKAEYFCAKGWTGFE